MRKKKGSSTTDKSVAPVRGDIRRAAAVEIDPFRPVGVVDVVSHERIAGWAWNPHAPEESIVVEIFDGPDLLMRVAADIFRDDLRDAGIGTGRYGFAVPSPGALLQLARHQIAVRRAGDGVDLLGSPQMLLRPAAGLDLSLTKFLNSAVSASAAVAGAPADLDEQVTLTLRILNQLLNARNALAGGRPLLNDPLFQDLLREAEVSDWSRNIIAKLEKEYVPVKFDAADDPLVSIVIPVCNEFRTTYNCLKSISDDLPRSSFEIVIVDDCSWDETLFAQFAVSGAVRFVRNSEKLGFVRCCNVGASHARGKYLLFLRNDSLVRPNWLDELVSTFDATSNVGIVGPKLLSADGSLHGVGGILGALGETRNWGRGADPNDPNYCFLRDADYLCGVVLMLQRDLFERLKGLDECYVSSFYADADLCLRIRADGERVVVQPAARVVHLEAGWAGENVRGDGRKRHEAADQRKFYQRWKEVLSTHRFNGSQPKLEAERGVTRWAYFIDDSVPTPDQDAGSNAALQHMLSLTRLGYKVMFLPAGNMAQLDPYTENLQKLGIECFHAPYYRSVEEVFRNARIAPDLVYLHRFTNASRYASFTRRYFPDCITVYNVADLHFLRQRRELAVEGSLGGATAVSEEAELAVMHQVDSVLVHSSVEAQLLRRKDAKLRVHTVPWAVLPRPCSMSFNERSGFAFVGGYGHRPNVDAAKFLAQEVAPLLQRAHPEMRGFLVGSNAPAAVTGLDRENIKVLGFVPHLSVFLHRLRCTVAPLRYGAGLKGKILESFAHGLPCVMSDVAAEGLNLPPALEWLVAGTPKEFSEKLGKVHEDEPLNQRLTAAGLQFIRERYNEAVIQRLLADATAKRE